MSISVILGKKNKKRITALSNHFKLSEDYFKLSDERFRHSDDCFRQSDDRFRLSEDYFKQSDDRFRHTEDHFRDTEDRFRAFFLLLSTSSVLFWSFCWFQTVKNNLVNTNITF
jgi:hypothetical protein